MARSIPEWIAKHDDQAVPPRVRLRIWERHNGICYLSGRKIIPGEPWQLDHIVALTNGGGHRESNLAPVLVDKHKVKTKADVAEKAKTARKKMLNLGIKHVKAKIQSRGFGQAPPQRKASRPLTKKLPPRRF